MKQHCVTDNSTNPTRPMDGHASKRIHPTHPATPSPVTPVPTYASQHGCVKQHCVTANNNPHPNPRPTTPTNSIAEHVSRRIRPTNHTTVEKTWQELTKNTDNKLVMMTVTDLGQQRTTRRKLGKNKQQEELEAATGRKETSKNKNKEESLVRKRVKKTSPVKNASTKKRQPKMANSPTIKDLKRLKPRKLTDIACSTNNCRQKLEYSPRKSVNFKTLVSKWEQFSKKSLTPAVITRPSLSDFVDSQSYSVLQKK